MSEVVDIPPSELSAPLLGTVLAVQANFYQVRLESKLSQGGFCTNDTIHNQQQIPKPAPTNQVPDQPSFGSTLNTQHSTLYCVPVVPD
ncbi:hypothetical protein [Coleofasciculus sp. E2-BRE-01]|uniref:hypothetical protein n=1 Tax=Coleofasciculus sp. E2-BRE-01 TaxID=3069524 RepID=UPI003303455E